MKIKIIDLFNKIANGEEVPKEVRFADFIFEYDEDDQMYYDNKYENICDYAFLNDEVEIIEEKSTQEEIKECTNKFLEVWKPINKLFGKLFDELLRIKNDLELNLEDEIEEEKKIPEKLDIRQEKNIKNNWKWKVYGKEHSYNISTPQKIIADKINSIIDYLKSKGDE